MGLFSRIAGGINQAFGGADAELLRTGTLGRGQIVSAVPSGGTVKIGGGLVERVCTIQVQVLLDGEQPYLANVQQRLPEVYLAQLQSGRAAVAVRVDPTHPQRIALDLGTPPPSVRLGRSAGPGSAAHILETGQDVEVVVVQGEPLGYQNYLGYEMYRFVLTVATGVPQPYQVENGNPVPPEALPLIYPGARLHAKRGEDPQRVVIDFDKGAVA